MAAVLTDSQIAAALPSVPEWCREADGIVRTFTRRDFVDAVEFVNRITELAEDANHHPDVDIRWNKVTLRLSTHSKGGLTETDFDLASQIDELA